MRQQHQMVLYYLSIACIMLSVSSYIVEVRADEISDEGIIISTTDESGSSTGLHPAIKFYNENLTYDFGKVQQFSKVEKIIKFKNVGQAVLKIEDVRGG